MRIADKLYSKIKDGFTLVEVMVGSALMAIVFTSAFGSYFLGMRLIEDAREQLRASQIIQSELERIRTMNWEQLNELGHFARFEPQGEFVQQFADDYISYRWVYPINNGDQMRVIVYVWWNNSKGNYTWEYFNTVVTKNGLSDYYYRKPPQGV